MAIAKSVPNALLLNRWPEIMGESIYTYNQVAGKGAPLSANCHVYIQGEREVIARALNDSIQKISRKLRYWPRPKWFTDTLSFGAGIPLKYQPIRVNPVEQGGSWKLIEFGQRATTIIDDNVTVTYTDNGYGVYDTASMTVPTALTNADEIQVFFRTADGAPSVANENYQIEPLQVTISGGNATITGPRWLFVKPNAIWSVPFVRTDPNNKERNSADSKNTSTDFVTGVDIYRVYNDNTTQIEVLDWNNVALDTFNAVIVDDELGFFSFESGCWDTSWCTRPTRLRAHYRAGEPLFSGYMDGELETAIMRLANVLMPNEMCALAPDTKSRWDYDRKFPSDGTSVLLSADGANNPWGLVTFGAVYAWRTAVDRAIAHGGKMLKKLW